MTTFQRYLLSSAVTFVSTFVLVFGANLLLNDTVPITGSVLVGIANIAVRAAFKAIFETAAGKTT